MHKFLRAIGFSHITKEQLQHIFADIISAPTVQKAALDSEGNEFAELSKEYGDFFGISVRGVYNEDDTFEMEYYYPYLCGKNISTIEPAEVEKHAEKESYAGICDEVRIGVTLIFYLQNVVDYLAVSKAEKKVPHAPKEGTDRNHLIAAARDGDEDAIENLTLEDIDTYSLLSKRITHEDVLSIVDTYFMPYGIESDQYSVLGEIMDVTLLQNRFTEENVYSMEIMCNDILFSVCINQKDLLGEPEVGRRFKGNIWMQGSVKYRD